MFIFINAMKITAFIYMIDTELMSQELYFHTDNLERELQQKTYTYILKKYFCCHINVMAEVKNSLMWLHIGTGQMSTDGFGRMAVKPQQLCNHTQQRPEAKRFISFAAADYFAQQPEPNFHSSLCLQKFYFSYQILIHKVTRNLHMVLSLHVFIWIEVSGLQDGTV